MMFETSFLRTAEKNGSLPDARAAMPRRARWRPLYSMVWRIILNSALRR